MLGELGVGREEREREETGALDEVLSGWSWGGGCRRGFEEGPSSPRPLPCQVLLPPGQLSPELQSWVRPQTISLGRFVSRFIP